MVDPLSYFSSNWCSTSGVKQRLWYVLSCLWDGAYKIILAANQKTSPNDAVVKSSANGLVCTGFASRYWLQPRVGF